MYGEIKIQLLGEFTDLNFLITSTNRFLKELNLTFFDINDYVWRFTYNDDLIAEGSDPLIEMYYIFNNHEIVLSFKNFFNIDTFYKMIKILREETSINIDFDEDFEENTENIAVVEEVAATEDDFDII